MNDFPRVNLPDVNEEDRAEVAQLIEKNKREMEIMQRNREGMIRAMIRKGTIGHGKGKRR